MKLVTEVGHDRQRVLIVDRNNTPLARHLKKLFESYDIDVFFSSIMPSRPANFDYLLLINIKPAVLTSLKNIRTKSILIYIHNKKEAQKAASLIHTHRTFHTKVVHLANASPSPELLEKIIWFTLSRSAEPLLDLSHGVVAKPVPSSTAFSRITPHITPRLLGTIILLFVVALHLMILPMLVAPSLFLHRSYKAIVANDAARARSNLQTAASLQRASHTLYLFARPTYAFLSLALTPDTIDSANEKTIKLLNASLNTMQRGQKATTLIFKKDKTETERALLATILASMQTDLKQIEQESASLLAQLPDSPRVVKDLKGELFAGRQFVHQLNEIMPHLPSILAQGGEKKYLLLFANNMELRPGGGFIGSFGVLDVADMTVTDIKVYDVYDADGQLLEHVEPPAAIREHLDQPHWFLRDSAFSPDFTDTYEQASIFLNKELGLTDFSGGILITTTAIQNILESFGNIYLPDFKRTINKDNFYIETQYAAENDFFPGSIQKKSFLGALSRQLLLSLEDADLNLFAQGLKKSLEEKQIVLAFSDQNIQRAIDGIYWGGRLIPATCASGDCVANYIFPLDANLGVNKANFFVSRLLRQRTEIKKDGRITNSVFVTIKNNSASTAFPGGPYKNYFQILLPAESLVNTITQNGKKLTEYDEEIGEYKRVGFLTTVAPQQTIELQIDYTLLKKLPAATSRYQLIVQKQIGAPSSDFILEMILPSNMTVAQSNFSPIVKGNRIFYNTSLSSDKIFVTELKKQ